MTFVIESSKTVKEIIQILRENTDEDIPLSKIILNDSSFEKFFRGQVTENYFKIQRCLAGQNGFLPIAYGIFSAVENGTMIRIKLTLGKAVKVFMGFWYAGVIALCVLLPLFQIEAKFWVYPYAMLIFGISLPLVTWLVEKKKLVEKLESLF